MTKHFLGEYRCGFIYRVLRLHPTCLSKLRCTTPIAAPPYNWSGFYVGANFGGGLVQRQSEHSWQQSVWRPNRIYWRRAGGL